MHCGDMFYHKSYRQPNLAYGAYFACSMYNIYITIRKKRFSQKKSDNS